ncbi:MAG: RNA 2',3'-cyclic phosphodiesterase [Planctomycetaceae bacterium]|nr:RNA 2',3'-cyclic phosphodiesterase [Planctomycetaceae bacterium]
MIRTFIAAEIGDDVRDALEADVAVLRAGAPLVKWVKTENLHLTLRFLGDVKENDLEELFDALEEGVAGIEPFALEMRGIGAFPNWRHPRVVWAGCGDGTEEAVDLAAAVEEVCVDLGYEAEKRPFRPHLTLGRVKLPADARGLEETVAAMGERVFGYIDVDAVVVFMSSLRRNGPVYAPMARFPLR